MRSYEQRLNSDLNWAMSEGSRHFEERSAVQQALRDIARRLGELGIAYAVAGGMALFGHGYRRFTDDVDILVTREGLQLIHETLEGRGYRPPFEGAKNLRDVEHGVRIEFLVAGQFPGDGKPKPVAFPDPAAASIQRDGIQYLKLPTLIELKLASGISSAARLRDLADVIELIKLLDLPQSFAQELNPYVQAKFAELWATLHETPKRYLRPAPRAELSAAMQADGVAWETNSGFLVTTDAAIAAKYDLHDEAEF